MRPTIYVAGPMRGRPDRNRAAFNAAAERLAAKGWQPVNPVDMTRVWPCEEADGRMNGMRLFELMEIERELVKRVRAIYLLDGWEASEGARTELRTFLDLGRREVHLESAGTPQAPGREALW